MKRFFSVLTVLFSLALGLTAQDVSAPKNNTPTPSAATPPPKESHVPTAPGARTDSVLASVNGDAITLLDIMLETSGEERELAGLFTGERLFSETEKIRRKALENIILRKLVYKSYRQRPFEIPKQEIESALDNLARNIADGTRDSLTKKMAEFGMPMDRLREMILEKIAVDVLLANECDRQVFITPREVYDEYRNHTDQWSTPDRIELQLIQLPRTAGTSKDDTLETACKEIRIALDKDSSAAAFSELVKKHSAQSNAAEGGFTGLQSRARIRPEFAKELEKNSGIGAVCGPIETPEAFYFLRVASKEPGKQKPFSQVSDQIHFKLISERIAKRRAEYSKELRGNAIIRYF